MPGGFDMTNCPICDNNQFRIRQITSKITIEICIQCGFLISGINQTEPIKAEFSQIIEEAYQESVGLVRRIQAKKIVQLVKQYVEYGKPWLDIGCSFGYLLAEAKRSGFIVLGVEPDEKAVKIARMLVGDEAVQRGLITDNSVPDSSQDIISMLDVLEHVPADKLTGIASLIHSKLKPTGLWLIKVPTTDGLYFSVAHFILRFSGTLLSGFIERLWQSEYEYPHTVYFNLNTLRSFLENHGYEVLEFTYLEDVPNNTIIKRLFMDDSISRIRAMISIPFFYLINFIDRVRCKSDALLVLARRKVHNDNDLPPTK